MPGHAIPCRPAVKQKNIVNQKGSQNQDSEGEKDLTAVTFFFIIRGVTGIVFTHFQVLRGVKEVGKFETANLWSKTSLCIGTANPGSPQ